MIKNVIINSLSNVLEREIMYEDTCRLEDLGLNSLNYIKLLVNLEIEFDIEFGDDELNNRNVIYFIDLVDLVTKK